MIFYSLGSSRLPIQAAQEIEWTDHFLMSSMVALLQQRGWYQKSKEAVAASESYSRTLIIVLIIL